MMPALTTVASTLYCPLETAEFSWDSLATRNGEPPSDKAALSLESWS
jgi:hypothetical protein